ncbi:hypothetical protein AAFC00_006720 [Neodothiora populina]|uniref:Letm1 RBD domain-containing protein n=1 Tax=Neodothiora populina TaxID=2781224 RepID=A0ABR3PB36_9PEZI
MTNTSIGSTRAICLLHSAVLRQAFPRGTAQRQNAVRVSITSCSHRSRSYASAPPPKFSFRNDKEALKKSPTPVSAPLPRPAPPTTDLPIDAAVVHGDGINPPRSTLPPPLVFPEKASDTSTPVYWYRVGRSYGRFYIAGVKATWKSYKVARELRNKIRASNADPANNTTGRNDVEAKAYPPRRFMGLMAPPFLLDVEVYMRREGLMRSQLQLLLREREDMKKLPLFAVMVALFGEWLPLIVPFIPGRVPRTCRIPKQITGMRKAVEERRRDSFRQGLVVPEHFVQAGVFEKIKARVQRSREVETGLDKESRKIRAGEDRDAIVDLEQQEGDDTIALRVQPANWLAVETTQALSRQQTAHVSTSLGLHSRLWERLGLVGGESPLVTLLLKMRVIQRLHYLNMDDELLVKNRMNDWHRLTRDELKIACEERGIDVSGRTEDNLRKDLGKWLDGRARDKGYGSEVVKMLFTRPNMW